MSGPFFSVVIPTRNRAHLLPRAVESVLRQDFDSYELIVVNDASTDSTTESLAGFRDPRLRVLHREQPHGAAGARNHGETHATGRWLAFLDDDDAYEPGFLHAMHRALRNAPPEVGFAWCGVRRLADDGDGHAGEAKAVLGEEIWRPQFTDRRDAYLGFLRNRGIGTNCGLTVQRSAFRSVGGFDEELPCAEDTDLLIRLARDFDFTVVPEILVNVHLHPGPRLTAYGAPMATAYRRILDKHRDELRDEPAVRAELEYKTGWLHYRAGDRGSALRHLASALRARPGFGKAWAALVLCGLPVRPGAALHDAASRLRKGTA